MIVPLSRSYTAKDGAPIVERVDRRIFWLSYYHHCMACTFCHDACCQYGADVEEPKLRALLGLAEQLEPLLTERCERWFSSQSADDPDYPGGRFTRTQVRQTSQGQRCVFADPAGRGCRLHSFALRHGLDVRDVKPMACNLFPVLWDQGALIVPLEIEDETLICRGAGVSLYRSARGDLAHYFGPELVAELDRLESAALAAAAPAGARPLPLASA